MDYIVEAIGLVWEGVTAATGYLLSIVDGCGENPAIFITTIVALMVVMTIFVALRYRTIGVFIGSDNDDVNDEVESEVMKHANSSANAVIYEKLKQKQGGK